MSESVFLIGHPMIEELGPNIPCKKDVLRKLYFYRCQKISVAQTFVRTTTDVINVFAKKGIPSILKQNVLRNLKKMHKKWENFKKSEKRFGLHKTPKSLDEFKRSLRRKFDISKKYHEVRKTKLTGIFRYIN